MANPFFGGAFFSGGFFGSLTGGTSKRDKKKTKVISRAKYSQDEYEKELAAAFAAIELKKFEPLEQAAYELGEEPEDDDLLLKVIALTVLH